VAEETNLATAKKVQELAKKGVAPGLAAVLVGENPASKLYVSMKQKACARVGIDFELHELKESVSEKKIVELIRSLNENKKITGLMVQLPLPKSLDKNKVLSQIALEKDVDGLNPASLGMLAAGEDCFVPATAKAILRLIEHTGIGLGGKHAVVIGRSTEVGIPTALLLLQQNATVTMCHSRTMDLGEETKKADVLVSAVGRPNLVQDWMVKQGAVVIDVGVNKIFEGGKEKLVGDVDFDRVKNKASWITPVPGGVGPVTVAMLLENCVEAVERIRGIP
jgi:methylenetetrahydrofolate dehydrogenase (NADP+)/methenyltetrahydrofolate cyclohydrolase